jgi:hypothetical protein
MQSSRLYPASGPEVSFSNSIAKKEAKPMSKKVKEVRDAVISITLSVALAIGTFSASWISGRTC